MTGSALAPVIIPIVAFGCLAVWIAMVFYADAHPMHRRRAARWASDSISAPLLLLRSCRFNLGRRTAR